MSLLTDFNLKIKKAEKDWLWYSTEWCSNNMYYSHHVLFFMTAVNAWRHQVQLGSKNTKIDRLLFPDIFVRPFTGEWALLCVFSAQNFHYSRFLFSKADIPSKTLKTYMRQSVKKAPPRVQKHKEDRMGGFLVRSYTFAFSPSNRATFWASIKSQIFFSPRGELQWAMHM